jgi:cysteine desulfurase
VDLERLYLDYNATSPLSQSVIHWLKSGEVLFANPSSQHTPGKQSRKLINETRSFLYSTFSLKQSEHQLFFHSGASEAFSSFAYSFSEWARLTGRELLICFSRLDHPCVTGLAERYFGSHVKFLELHVDQNLAYEDQRNEALIRDRKENNPDLLILYHHLWVHNETGAVSPLEKLRFLKTISDLYIHVDAVQAPGKIPDWRELAFGDIFAHKIGALKGLGFSFFHTGIEFHPFVAGGGQQSGLRAGTENVTGVQSLKLALTDLLAVDVQRTMKLKTELEQFLQDALRGKGEVISQRALLRNSNTIYFYLYDHPSDIALALFDVNGVALSAGSACSSGAAKASLILGHLRVSASRNGLRISLPFEVTGELLEAIKERITHVLAKL